MNRRKDNLRLSLPGAGKKPKKEERRKAVFSPYYERKGEKRMWVPQCRDQEETGYWPTEPRALREAGKGTFTIRTGSPLQIPGLSRKGQNGSFLRKKPLIIEEEGS